MEGMWQNMRLMARVLAIKAKDKGKTGTVLDFDSGTGLIIIGFDDGTKGKIEKADLLEINDLEDLDFEVGQNVYVTSLDRVGEIVSIADNKHTIRFQDQTKVEIVLNEEKDSILSSL
jgi:hypothetical protein